MNIATPIFRLVFTRFLPVLALVALETRSQDRPVLDLLRRDPSGIVHLQLKGKTGANHIIESSLNLSSWSLLSSGVAADGVLSFRHDAASNYSTLFYRGRVATVETLPPISLGLRLSTNTAASSVVNHSASSSVLYGASGTRYTLRLASNSIPDARILTLTEVTNFTGLPFANGVIGAVRVEPADLVFWGAAALEISFPTNIDRRQITSFAARSDGSAFRLTLDRVGTNRILVPITRAGVYGSSVSTAQELADAARREISPAVGLLAALHQDPFDCQAARKLSAQAMEQELRIAFEMRAQAYAARLGEARKSQLSGATDDSVTALEEATEGLCDFYNALINPRWNLATNNCALGKVLIQYTFAASRQRQLLGATDEAACGGASTIPFCDIYKNCLEEIKQCCEAGDRGAVKVAEVRSLQRQDQLLGSGCITDERAQEVIDVCSSNLWTGTYTVLVSGQTNITTKLSNGVTIDIDEFETVFEGTVIESQEFGSVAGGYVIELRVAGPPEHFRFQQLYDSVEWPVRRQLQVNRTKNCCRNQFGIQRADPNLAEPRLFDVRD